MVLAAVRERDRPMIISVNQVKVLELNSSEPVPPKWEVLEVKSHPAKHWAVVLAVPGTTMEVTVDKRDLETAIRNAYRCNWPGEPVLGEAT